MSKSRPSYLRLVVNNSPKAGDPSMLESGPVSSVQKKTTELGGNLFILPPNPDNYLATLRIPKAFDEKNLIKRAPKKLHFTDVDVETDSIKLTKTLNPDKFEADELLRQFILIIGDIRRGIIKLYGHNYLEVETVGLNWSIEIPIGKKNSHYLPIIPPFILNANSKHSTFSVEKPTVKQLIHESKDALTHSRIGLLFDKIFNPIK